MLNKRQWQTGACPIPPLFHQDQPRTSLDEDDTHQLEHTWESRTFTSNWFTPIPPARPGRCATWGVCRASVKLSGCGLLLSPSSVPLPDWTATLLPLQLCHRAAACLVGCHPTRIRVLALYKAVVISGDRVAQTHSIPHRVHHRKDASSLPVRVPLHCPLKTARGIHSKPLCNCDGHADVLPAGGRMAPLSYQVHMVACPVLLVNNLPLNRPQNWMVRSCPGRKQKNPIQTTAAGSQSIYKPQL